MENIGVYEDIRARTDGDIYVGVVGPVRTGKSTFIKNFMDLLVIPNIENSYKRWTSTECCGKNNNDHRTQICA